MPRRTNPNEFMFFSSQTRAIDLLAALAHGDVDIGAQRPLLHLGVRDPELDDRLPQETQEAVGLVGRAEVRVGDDLDERRAAAVEVDEARRGADRAAGRAAGVHRLRGVLFEMHPHDADDSSPSAVGIAKRPGPQSGASYWLIW